MENVDLAIQKAIETLEGFEKQIGELKQSFIDLKASLASDKLNSEANAKANPESSQQSLMGVDINHTHNLDGLEKLNKFVIHANDKDITVFTDDPYRVSTLDINTEVSVATIDGWVTLESCQAVVKAILTSKPYGKKLKDNFGNLDDTVLMCEIIRSDRERIDPGIIYFTHYSLSIMISRGLIKHEYQVFRD